jgi:ankyrin repeat protein
MVPLDGLVGGYLRSPRFADCLRILFEAGAALQDPLLRAVLLDDAPAVRRLATAGADVHRLLRVPCAFTSCDGVTPLHLCAEFNSVGCAGALLEAGAEVNARAATDRDGFGGQTPVFHAVNSIFNFCRPVLELLVEAGAALDLQLKGLVWGRNADWETLVLDVTPMSYAQCGLYPQFHRGEPQVYDNLSYLYGRRYGGTLPVRNVPNRYLAPKH